MAGELRNLNRLIIDIRLCFHRLKAVADGLHADLGINSAMRGVLETLADGGDWTVPRIARAKGVSRQHIQVTVDTLRAAGLVEPRANPAHRRSPLIVTTARGAAGFAEMRRREAAVLDRFAGELSPDGVAAARETLSRLNELLDDTLETMPKGDKDG